MKKMLNLENIQIIEQVSNWEEAVKVAVQPLVDGGYCEARYIDGIIENTHEFGPYYVLCENFALLHARPDQGVLEKQLAVTILRKAIKFKKDGYDVRILVTLAATDSESHIKAMQAISIIFSSQDKIQQLLKVKNTQEVYDVFEETKLL